MSVKQETQEPQLLLGQLLFGKQSRNRRPPRCSIRRDYDRPMRGRLGLGRARPLYGKKVGSLWRTWHSLANRC